MNHSSSNQSFSSTQPPSSAEVRTPARLIITAASSSSSSCYLGEAELHHQAVSDELDVLLHQLTVHPDQLHRQSFGQELLRMKTTSAIKTSETPTTRRVFVGRRPPTCSISTAFLMMPVTVSTDGLFTRCLNIRQAKSQCRP